MRSRTRIAFSLAAIFVSIILLPLVVSACSCIRGQTVEQKLADSENIVAVKVISTEKSDDEDRSPVNGLRSATLLVERVFKGPLKVGQELVFNPGGGGADCRWTFYSQNIGNQYLFYLDEGPKEEGDHWYASICAGNKSLEMAAAEIYYLEKAARMKGKTRISGLAYQAIETAIAEGYSSRDVLAGKKVRIKGMGKNITLKTDKNGVYEIYDLPAGKYTIAPEPIAGYRPYVVDEKTYTASIELGKKGHVEFDLGYRIINSVKGNLVDPEGKPLDDVTVKLFPIGGKEIEYFSSSTATTDKAGKFEFENVPAGNYTIVVNAEGAISPAMPFGKFYYPGKASLDDAGKFTTSPGGRIEGLVIKAPEMADTITISGVLSYEDGTPAGEEWIEFYEEANNSLRKEKYIKPDANTKTDEKGRFSLRLLKGQKGFLFGSTYESQQSDFPCPKMDALLSLLPSGYGDLETSHVYINASADYPDQKLMFPFLKCKRRP